MPSFRSAHVVRRRVRAHRASSRNAAQAGERSLPGVGIVFMDYLITITPWPLLSVLLWSMVTISVLYFARATAHQAIRAAASGLHRSLRVASRAVERGEARLGWYPLS